jgi:hypothetical protein
VFQQLANLWPVPPILNEQIAAAYGTSAIDVFARVHRFRIAHNLESACGRWLVAVGQADRLRSESLSKTRIVIQLRL